MLLCIFLLALAVLIRGLIDDNCPVSSHIDNAVYWNYPIDIYTNYDLYDAKKGGNEVQNCQVFRELTGFGVNHTCSIRPLGICPIKDTMAYDFHKFDKLSSISLDSICKLTNTNNTYNTNKRRMFVFGGSIPFGSGTGGCTKTGNIRDTTCSWGKYFSDWFSNYFNFASFEFINFSESGYSSKFMYDNFLRKVTTAGVSNFTEYDIIFLDHSFNDQRQSFLSDNPYFTLYYLERLVMKILQMSVGTGPDIYMLESWPYYSIYGPPLQPAWDVQLKIRPNQITYKFDYGKMYRDVAKYYNLTLLSYRDVVWSENLPFPIVDSKYPNQQYAFNFFRHLRIEFNYDAHSAWHIHLLWADLIASSILKSINAKCFKGSAVYRPVQWKQDKDINIWRPRYVETPIIPDKVFQNMFSCAGNDHMLLSIYAIDSYTSTGVQIGKLEILSKNFALNVGKKSISLPSEFVLMTDEKNRAGWESKRPANSSDYMFAAMRFHFDNRLVTSAKDVVFNVNYLRTYHNGGRVIVRYCGFEVNSFDCLWSDPLAQRISIPQTESFKVHGRIFETCRLNYIEFVHVAAYSRVPVIVEQRTVEERVKIISVDACVVDHQSTV